MSEGAFDSGGIFGTLGLDISEYTDAVRESSSLAGEFAAQLGHILSAATGSPALGALANGIGEVTSSLASGNFAEAFAASIHTAGELTSGFIEVLKSEAEQMEQAGLAAEKAGVSVEWISSVGKAAQSSGAGIEDLGMAMKILEDRQAKARDNDKDAIAAFAEVGISVDDLKNQLADPRQLFLAIADSMSQIEDPARKTQAAMDLMGRAGMNMVPFLDQGGKAIEDLGGQITATGGAFTKQDAEIGHQTEKLGVLFESTIAGMEKEAAKPILQYLIAHSKELTSDMMELSQWMGQNVPAAMDTALKMAEKLGSALAAVSGIISNMDWSPGSILRNVGESEIDAAGQDVLGHNGSYFSHPDGPHLGPTRGTPNATGGITYRGAGGASSSVNVTVNVQSSDPYAIAAAAARATHKATHEHLQKLQNQLDSSAKVRKALSAQ